jgi:hypothetical protein
MISLYDYLIKHIKINVDKKFIKKFYQIQKRKGIFKIDLDIVVGWLNVKLDNLIFTLKKTYIKDQDYIITTETKKEKKWGGHLKKKYY